MAVTADAPAAGFVSHATAPIFMPSDPLYSRYIRTLLEWITRPLLVAGVLSLVWMILRARGTLRAVFSEAAEVASVAALWTVLFVVVSAVGLMSTKNQKE